MNRIQIDIFDANSIENAIKELRAYQESIEPRVEEVIGELADMGAYTAQQSFDSVYYSDPDDTGVIVYADKTKRGAEIKARGDQVAFREFGTGVKYGYGHPMPRLEDGTSMEIGSWSESPQGKGHWNDPNGWSYKTITGRKVRTYGDRPAKGMYNAMIEILTNADSVIRKIFK